MTVNIGGRDCVLGIDVSRWQPNIDWRTVASCRQFAIIKATGGDGGTYGDQYYPRHAAASKGLLPRGAYHFLGQGDGAAQARAFLAATGGYADLELPPTVDFETYGPNGSIRPSADTLRQFIAEIHRGLDRRWAGPNGDPVAVIVYTGAPMAAQTYGGLERFDLWLAAYLNGRYPNPSPGVTNGTAPNIAALGVPDRFVPKPWSRWSAWQFAGGDGGCPGVGDGSTGCDQNVMTVEMFSRLLGSTPPEDDDMTPQEWANWLVAPDDRTNPNGDATADDVLSAQAVKTAYWLGRAKAEGQHKVDRFVTLEDIGHELIEPNNGAGPAEEGRTRRAIDDVWQWAQDIKAKLGA